MISRALGLEAGQRWEFGRYFGGSLVCIGIFGLALTSSPLWLPLGMCGLGYALWRLA